MFSVKKCVEVETMYGCGVAKLGRERWAWLQGKHQWIDGAEFLHSRVLRVVWSSRCCCVKVRVFPTRSCSVAPVDTPRSKTPALTQMHTKPRASLSKTNLAKNRKHERILNPRKPKTWRTRGATPRTTYMCEGTFSRHTKQAFGPTSVQRSR